MSWDNDEDEDEELSESLLSWFRRHRGTTLHSDAATSPQLLQSATLMAASAFGMANLRRSGQSSSSEAVAGSLCRHDLTCMTNFARRTASTRIA